MKKLIQIILIFSVFVGNIYADVTRVISYQGVLVGADGKPESGNKRLTFTIINDNSQPHSSGFNHTQEFLLQGGLFFAELGNLQYSNIPFPTLEGQWYLQITDGVNPPYPKIPLYSTVSALNIADNVVTSEKIKDGEVKAEDLHDMGASVGQVLTKTSTSWQGVEIPKELPQASEGQILVFKNGSWQAENPVIPSGVPVGTVLPYMGDGFDLTKLQSQGWFLCDGRSIAQIGELSSSEKDTLQNILSRAGVVNAVNLPDLRGYFLRGADRGQGRDPDFGGRLGNGEKIGSVQGDEIKKHSHTIDEIRDYSLQGNIGGDYTSKEEGRFYTKETNNFGGSETRPINVYVNYIIKAK